MSSSLADYRKQILKAVAQDETQRDALRVAVADLRQATPRGHYLMLDLAWVLALPDSPLTEEMLTGHSRALDLQLNKANGPVADQVRELKALLVARGDFGSPTFWAELAHRRQEAVGDALAAAAQDVARAHPVGAVSLDRARALLSAQGLPGQGDAEVTAALHAVGVVTFHRIEAPPATSLAAVRSPWRALRDQTGALTLFDALSGAGTVPLRDGRFLQGLFLDGQALSRAELPAIRAQVQNKQDTDTHQAIQKLLLALVNLPSDENLG